MLTSWRCCGLEPVEETEEMREMLEELQRRKDAEEGVCESCDGRGLWEAKVCMDCLGQGILLHRREYDWLLSIANAKDDGVLSDEFID